MKKIIPLLISTAILFLLTGCKEEIVKFRQDAQTQVKETVEGVKELGHDAREAAGEVKQTIKDVEDAAREIKEAKDAIKKVVE